MQTYDTLYYSGIRKKYLQKFLQAQNASSEGMGGGGWGGGAKYFAKWTKKKKFHCKKKFLNKDCVFKVCFHVRFCDAISKKVVNGLGNTKWGRITVLLTSCYTGLD
jgi:hypothetical protein